MQHKKHSKKRVLILFFSLYILLGGLVITLNQTTQRQDNRSLAAGDCTVTPDQIATKPIEKELFDMINQYRLQNSRGVLAWNVGLKIPAAWLSKDMLTSGNMSHVDSLGRNPAARLGDCGVSLTASYGENIARGSPNAQEIFNAWKESPGHNQIMLDTAYNQGAVSMEAGGDTSYWTLDVAGSINVNPTIVIDPTPIFTSTPPAGATRAPQTGTTIFPTISSFSSVAPTNSNNPNPTNIPNPTSGLGGGGGNPDPTTGPVGVDVQISAKVKILGIGKDGNPSPKQLTRRVTAAVYGVEDKPLVTGNAFLTYDSNEGLFGGVIHLGKLAQGAYFIKLYTDNSLQTLARPEFQNLMIDRVNQLPTTTLYQGDITRDNVLNLDDYNAVLPCFQDKKCDTQKDIDFNDDGLTDVKDYNLLLRSFSQQPGN